MSIIILIVQLHNNVLPGRKRISSLFLTPDGVNIHFVVNDKNSRVYQKTSNKWLLLFQFDKIIFT